MGKTPVVNVNEFWTNGYVILRGAFSPAEIEDLRQRALRSRSHKGDLLSNPAVRGALLDERLLGVVRQILGDTPVYFGDSTALFGNEDGFCFHKDNVDRNDPNAPDWRGRYPLVRFGLYLQDHSRHSGGLHVIPGSHNTVKPERRGINTRTRPGDLVVWNLRTHHAGNGVVLRLAPGLYIEPPTLAWSPRYLFPLKKPFPMRIPRFLIAPEQRERVALFGTFGLEGEHLDRFLTGLRARTYAVEKWRASRYDDAVWEAVEGKDLIVRNMPEEIKDLEGIGLSKDWAPLPY